MSHCGFAYGRKGAEELARIAREDGELMVRTKEALEKIGIPIRGKSAWAQRLPAGRASWSRGSRRSGRAPMSSTMPATFLLGIVGEEDCAAAVLATVISRPTPRRVVIDAGSKSVAKEAKLARAWLGIVKNLPGAVLERVYEEHGVIELPADFLPSLPSGISSRSSPTIFAPSSISSASTSSLGKARSPGTGPSAPGVKPRTSVRS